MCCTYIGTYVVRYRQSLDPTLDEVRRLATGLRRSARDERVLFHYNGHGVGHQRYYFVLKLCNNLSRQN